MGKNEKKKKIVLLMSALGKYYIYCCAEFNLVDTCAGVFYSQNWLKKMSK